MANKKHSEYSVGYKRPPRHTQFKPGRSGNAMGRPKKDKNVIDVVQKELRSSIIVRVGSKSQRVTKLEAIIKQHINKAAQGDPKSTALLFALLRPAANGQGDNLHELLQEFRERNERQMAGTEQARAAKHGGSEPLTVATEPKRSEPEGQ